MDRLKGRWFVVAVGATLAAVAIFAGLPKGARLDDPRPPSNSALVIGFGGLARIDAATNEIDGWVPFPGVSGLAVDDDAVWVISAEDGFQTATQIDPVSSAIVSTVRVAPLRASTPRAIAVGEGAVWVISADSLFRIDPETNEVTRVPSFAAGSSLSAIAVGAGAVWVTDPTTQTVYRIDPRTNAMSSRIRVPYPAGVAFGHGSLWVSSSVNGQIFRIDPSANRVIEHVAAPGASFGVSAGAKGIWAANSSGDTIGWIDPATGTADQIRVGRNPTDVTVSAGLVWVSNSQDGTVSVIDPRRNRVVATIGVGPRPYLLGASKSGIWVALLGRATPPTHA